MENTFILKIASAEKEFYEGPAISLTIPAFDGSLQILAHHENMVVATVAGTIRFTTPDDTEEIRGIAEVGFASIVDNVVTVLVRSIEYPSELEEARTREAAERAKETLRQDESLQEYNQSRAAMATAMQRLSSANKGLRES